jgi:cytochrome c-type biogenesis protein
VNLTDLAVSGPLLLALTAGAVSFASPCCLPLVPGYLAYLAGLVGATPPPVSTVDGPTGGRCCAVRARIHRGFRLHDDGGARVSDAMLVNEQLLQRLGGVITIVMGLVFLEAFPVLQRGMRPRHTPATACGALRCSAPSTAWAGRRVWARRWP